MLRATRREANELYTLFHLLSEGFVSRGDADGQSSNRIPLAAVMRKEHDGVRRYVVDGESIRICSEEEETSFPREDFGEAARLLLACFGESGDDLDISVVEGFLDALNIFDMEAQTDDRTDMHLQLWTLDGGPMVGVRIQSRLCGLLPLLDGGRTANLKYEQTGVRFSQPAVHKINWTEHPEDLAEVARRILYIERLGGNLKYADVADKVFRSNLLMLDTNLPRILAAMLRTLHLDGVTRVCELTALLTEHNPLKMKEELVRKHGFYEYKVRQLLLAAAWGMRPAKQFNGRMAAVNGYLFVDGKGRIVLFTQEEEQVFSDFLFTHARLEKSLPEADHYGYLERENGAYYLKLNLKIGLKF